MTSAITTKPTRLDPDTSDHVPLRRVVGLFLPYRWQMLLLMLVVVVQAAFGVSSPFFLRAILDHAIPERNTLDKGHVVERGTHDELMAMGWRYAHLAGGAAADRMRPAG